jgi:hypothetical protein
VHARQLKCTAGMQECGSSGGGEEICMHHAIGPATCGTVRTLWYVSRTHCARLNYTARPITWRRVAMDETGGGDGREGEKGDRKIG